MQCSAVAEDTDPPPPPPPFSPGFDFPLVGNFIETSQEGLETTGGRKKKNRRIAALIHTIES